MMLDLGLKVEIFDRDELMGETMKGAMSSTFGFNHLLIYCFWAESLGPKYILKEMLGSILISDLLYRSYMKLYTCRYIYNHLHVSITMYLSRIQCGSWTHPSHALLSRAAKVTRVWRWEKSGEGG